MVEHSRAQSSIVVTGLAVNLPDESTTSTSSRLETLNVFVRNGAIFASKYCLELYFGGPIRLQYPQNPNHIVRQQTCAARNCT